MLLKLLNLLIVCLIGSIFSGQAQSQSIAPPCPKEKVMVFAGFDYYSGCACPGCSSSAVLMAYDVGTNPNCGCGGNNKCNTDTGPAGLMQGGGGGGVGLAKPKPEVFVSRFLQDDAQQNQSPSTPITTADKGDFVWKNGPVKQEKKFDKDLTYSPQVGGFVAKACELDSKYGNGMPGFAKAGDKYFILYRLTLELGDERKSLNIGAEIERPESDKILLYTDTSFDEKTGILKIKQDGRLKGFEFTVSIAK